MFKKILLSIVLLAIAAYLMAAITVFNRKPATQVCNDIQLVIKDSVYAGFITKKEVSNLLKKKGISPQNRPLEQVHTQAIEQELSQHPLIERVECYKTPGGNVNIEVYQRIPILRIMSSNGDNYYLDNKGTIMPATDRCIAHRAVATGKIEKTFALKYLYKFGVFLQRNPFWDAQIEQIHVLDAENVELVPRVGNHVIYLGSLDNFENKLKRLKVFYEKALNRVGWNKYSRISVEFDNQIICTKR